MARPAPRGTFSARPAAALSFNSRTPTRALLLDKEFFLRFLYHPIPIAAGNFQCPRVCLGWGSRGTSREPTLPNKAAGGVHWTTKSGNGEAQTESEDITSRGVYFFLPTETENGSWVELVIVLPHEITLAEPVRARCQGRVRRTEIKEMERVGVAAEIERCQFLREGENALAPGLQIPGDKRARRE